MITKPTARRSLVSHTAAAPPSRTSVTLASATIHAILLFTLIPLLPAYMSARDGPDQTFYVIRKHLELTCREPKPARVVDGSPRVHEDDDAVFALQHCIHLFVNTRRVLFECLP
jgi:hypothetical protein